MAGTFPTIKSGNAVVSFQTMRGPTYKTTVLQFLDKSEQRWQSMTALGHFNLVLTNIEGYDLSQIRAFWISQKGAFDFTWTLPALRVGDPTYAHCSFVDDSFEFVESKPNRYSGVLKVIQTTG